MAIDRAQAEALFTANLQSIERILTALSRRNGMRGDDADDFASWARLRLIEDGFARIRKFRGESSLASYLTVVLSMLLREYRVVHWGRWRPTAAALRAGPLAVRLETLVRRDGMPFAQAAEALRTSGETALDDRKLAELLARCPDRPPLRPVPADPGLLDVQPSPFTADGAVEAEQSRDEREIASRALSDALDALPDEDRLIVRLRFWEGLTVPEIARATGLDQKPIYRRIERALNALRSALEARGLTAAAAGAIVADSAC